MAETRSPGIPRDLAERVRLVIFDVDGVLTDAGVYLGHTESGEPIELKRFDIVDGLGLHLLVYAGLRVGIVSGRVSSANRMRAEELGLPYHEGPHGHKLVAAEAFLAEENIGWDEVAVLCDDLPDLPLLKRAVLPAAVANAVPEVQALACWSTTKTGGRGAAREFCEALLRARGDWERVLARYTSERDAEAALR
jgi:3-deoxy-D-manno-octulosonate 8-phosphate phosphatase (KDO 8-P phosphatase)